MSQHTQALYKKYQDTIQKAADLQFSSAVLGWDQEVYMPPKGAPFRGRQLATLASMAHEMMTADEYGATLAALSANADLNEKEKCNILLSREDYDKNKKLAM